MKSSVTDLLGNTLEIAVNQTAIAAITGYQKYISPRKGFSCAYRVLQNSDSCSQYIKKLIAKYGIIDAIPLARKRLKACRNAYIILKSETHEGDHHHNKRNCGCLSNPKSCCAGICDPGCDGIDFGDIGDCG